MAAGDSRVQKLRAVRVLMDADALGLLRAEAPDHLPQLGADVLLVVNDGNVKHRDPPFDTHRIREGGRTRQGLLGSRRETPAPGKSSGPARGAGSAGLGREGRYLSALTSASGLVSGAAL